MLAELSRYLKRHWSSNFMKHLHGCMCACVHVPCAMCRVLVHTGGALVLLVAAGLIEPQLTAGLGDLGVVSDEELVHEHLRAHVHVHVHMCMCMCI